MQRPIRTVEVIDDATAAVFRRMDGAQRLRLASGMYASARRMLASQLRALHPDWDPTRIAKETARRLSHGAC
jgi:hypothetical protein